MSELINTNAATLQQFSNVEILDNENPAEAINTLRGNEDFKETDDVESWFAIATVDGEKVAMYGEGSLNSEHTPIQYIKMRK